MLAEMHHVSYYHVKSEDHRNSTNNATFCVDNSLAIFSQLVKAS